MTFAGNPCVKRPPEFAFFEIWYICGIMPIREPDQAVWNRFWDSKNDIDKVYPSSPTILKAILKNFPRLEGKKILEVGAGSGRDSAELARRGADVYVLDFAEGSLKIVNGLLIREHLEENLHLVRGDAFHAPFPDGTFDLVFHQGLAEHFTDPKPLIRENFRIVRPGGYCLCDVPQTVHPYTVIKHILIAMDKWFAGWETQFTMAQLKSLMRGAAINITLSEETQKLGDIVVVGYGTQRKKDLTGSITSVSSDDFNGGLVSSPEQLISGKVAGVQIMQSSGSPTSGSTIRIRGGASLNASNDPLIVLDGVPLEIGGISGNSSNFMALINPNDIESMTVLKDASSTAIYGSRASNGVIIITTKKGSTKGMKIAASSTNSIQHAHNFPDMLSQSQFIDVVKSQATAEHQALLGSANSDWNDEIYRLAFGTDNNVSLSGSVANIPYRVSAAYYNQDGVLDTDNAA